MKLFYFIFISRCSTGFTIKRGYECVSHFTTQLSSRYGPNSVRHCDAK